MEEGILHQRLEDESEDGPGQERIGDIKGALGLEAKAVIHDINEVPDKGLFRVQAPEDARLGEHGTDDIAQGEQKWGLIWDWRVSISSRRFSSA